MFATRRLPNGSDRGNEGETSLQFYVFIFLLSPNKSFFDCLIFTRSNLFDEKVQTCQKDVWRFTGADVKTRNRKIGILWEEMWRQDYAYRWSHIKILNLANGNATTCAALSASVHTGSDSVCLQRITWHLFTRHRIASLLRKHFLL